MYDDNLETRKNDILFKQARGAILAAALAAVIIAFVFWNIANSSILVSWVVAVLVFSILKEYWLTRFTLAADETEKNRWRRYFVSAVFTSGCIWGFIGVYIIHTQPLTYSAIMILLSGYLITGASLNYSIFMSTYLAFTIPVIIPVIGYLLMQGEALLLTYGILLSIFYGFSILSALRYRSMTTTFLTYEINNTSLLNDLRQEQAEASRLNRELEQDLVKLRQTEDQLRQEKGKAEELADKLLTISSRDGLTGIANRRSFDDFLAREWNRAIRAQTPLSLILCDIDHFKAYNDYYGHQEGDKCLIRIAGILDENARRGGDLAARYGGEEFTLILPETSLENATEIAEQIRIAVENAAIFHKTSDTDNIVTISFGVATAVPRREQDSRVLISLADKALYEAKQNGRNRVVPSKPVLQSQQDQKDQA